MTDTSTLAPRISEKPTGGSYVEWSAIFAGAIVASAIIVLMTAFGSAIGLSLVSPYQGPLRPNILHRARDLVHLDHGLQLRGGRIHRRPHAPTARRRDDP